MSTVPAVVLVLGAGANVGQSPARACAAEGYKVALTARRLKEIDSTAEQLHIPADLSDPKTVVEVFSTVKGEAGDSQRGHLQWPVSSSLAPTYGISDEVHNLTISLFQPPQQPVQTPPIRSLPLSRTSRGT